MFWALNSQNLVRIKGDKQAYDADNIPLIEAPKNRWRLW